MKVMNKKTGVLHDVPKHQWEEMRSRNDHRKYTVVDDSDDHFVSEEISVEPVPMFSEEKEIEVSDIPEGEQKWVDDEAEFYRDKLREADVYFHPNTGIEKLRQKYEAL